MTPGTRKLGCRQKSSIWSLLAVFVGCSTQFLAPGTISTTHDPGYTKIGTSSKLVDLVISGCFYSTEFWAPETISTAHDPGYMKIGTSSKIIDLLISGRFRGYRTQF